MQFVLAQEIIILLYVKMSKVQRRMGINVITCTITLGISHPTYTYRYSSSVVKYLHYLYMDYPLCVDH